MYVRRIVLLPTKVCMIQAVDLLANHPLVEAWSVSPSNTPWWRCGWKPCWTQLRTSPLCERQLRLQKSQNDENDKGLSSRPVAPRPDKYVGLDLTWSDAETSAGARLESWGVSRLIRLHQDDVSDKANRPLGIAAEVEVDDLRLRELLEVEVHNSLKAWLHLIENWSLINRIIRPLIVW